MNDAAEIERVIRQYAHGIDHGDAAMVNACFARDVELDIDAGRIHHRGDAVRAFYEESLRNSPIRAMTHMMGNVLVDVIDGEHAHAETTALAFLDLADTGVVVVRGLDYSDDFVREDGQWLIARRLHWSRWQFDASRTDASAAEALVRGQRAG